MQVVFVLCLCNFQNGCKIRHEKEVLPSSTTCALPRANKNRLIKLSLPHDAVVCKAQGRRETAKDGA